jgi:hypothetical protein
MRYSRWSPRDVLPEVERHVRMHLSSVADLFDDSTAYAAVVRITHVPQGDGVLVIGELDAEPDAPYLREGFDPEQDVRDNPLSVPSIEEQR